LSTKLEDILRLNKTHIKAAIKVLTRAFQDYPLFNYYYPDKITKEKIAYYFSSVAIFRGMSYGELYATSHNLEGVSIWMPSDEYQMNFWRLLRSVPLHVLFGFGRYGGNKMRDLGQHIDIVHYRLAPFRHWYLQTIGVEPQFRGKGYASRLLRPMLTRIEEEGLPCYVDTLAEQNVLIYEHLGFKVIEETTVPRTTLTNWAMLKKPKVV